MKKFKEGELIYIKELDAYGKAAQVSDDGQVISAYVDQGKGERIIQVASLVIQAVGLIEKLVLAIKSLFK